MILDKGGKQNQTGLMLSGDQFNLGPFAALSFLVNDSIAFKLEKLAFLKLLGVNHRGQCNLFSNTKVMSVSLMDKEMI